MLKADDKVHLRLPKEDSLKKRVLRPGIVLSVQDDVCVIQLDEPSEGIEESADVFLHFEQKRNFLQQSARVVRKDSEQPMVLAIELRGTPVSAEARQCFRVSCLGANIKATVGNEPDCEVVDISATGFAFYGRVELEIGKRVQIKLVHDGKEYTGHGTIQSARRMTPKMMRHGVHCTDTGGETLAKALAPINLAVQTEQRRRLAGQERG